MPPIPDGKKRRKRGQDSQAKNFDLNDNSDSEDESKSDTASMEEQKIDISPTPPKKIVLDPIRPSNKNSKRPPPSFRGLQRLNTMHRKKITRQMSALDKLDLDRDGELEREEVVDAYVKNGLSQEEAEAKVNELVAKYDIDGDGTISLKEALNTEIAGAMEEEEHDIERKMKHREDTQRTEHINKTQERLKKRMQKRGRKKKKGDEPNPNKDKLAKGDLVEFRITESSNAKKAKISNYDTRTGTYEVSLKGGQIIKDLTREQITLLPPQQFDRSKSPKRDGRPLPTKTMRSSNQNAQRNEQIKEAYNDRMKKKSMTKNEEDTDGTSSSDDDF